MNSKVLGIVALVAGIIGMLTSCILIGIVPCFGALVIGILLLAKREGGKTLPIISIILSSVGIIIFGAMCVAVANEMSTMESSEVAQVQEEQIATDEYTLSVETESVDDSAENILPDAGQLELQQTSEETVSEQSSAVTQESQVQVTPQPSEVTSEITTTMEVHFIDVGQGDATLIKNGEHTMLIDSGENDKGTTVQLYLKKQGVEKLDYLVLTHTDSDHIGGADVILEKFEVDTVFMGNFEKDTATYRDVIQALDNKGLTWSQPSVGEQYTLGDATFTIIAPNDSYDDPNNTSIGLLLEKGESSFVFTGDAEADSEEDIVTNGIDIDADVFKSGHHGSKTSSDEALLDAITPEYAVISCGEGNSYGFPHARTLNNLRARGVQVFRTDEQGSIIATTNGTEITWNCAPSETWQVGEATESSTSQQLEQDSNSVDTLTTTYICNTNTKKFHYAACRHVKKMADKNKLETNASRDEIISQGYDPCGTCNP